MKLIILGCGSGLPAPDKGSSSYWLEAEKTNLVVDCGDGCSRGILSQGLDPLKIDALAISHLHADHWGGFGLFIQMAHVLKRKKPLTVLLPETGIIAAQKLLEVSFMWKERLGFEIIWKKWTDGTQSIIGDFTVTPSFNTHLDGYLTDSDIHPEVKLESFSFGIKCADAKGVYSGDIGELSDLDILLEKTVDWLLVEGMHFPLDEFPSWLDSKDIGKTIITHIPSERERERFADNVIIAREGLIIEY